MKRTGFLLLAAVALSLGFLTYWIEASSLHLPAIFRNHLADGLWATSFIACICCVWHNHTFFCYTWSAIAILSMLAFEMLQYHGQIKGVGDPLDVIAYLAFSLPVVAISHQKKK
jgi:hypothetical protein